MSRIRVVVLVAVGLSIAALTLRAEPAASQPAAVELFNGKDLTGWGFKDGDTFDGKTASTDNRFTAENGMIVVHNRKPTEPTETLWTTTKFPKDFVLTLEFKASVNADSGVFIRGPQLQVRDYLVAGPYKQLKKYKPQEWNQIVITVKGTTAHCECNGEVLEDALKIPATGGIGLEADRNEMDYRNLKLTETN